MFAVGPAYGGVADVFGTATTHLQERGHDVGVLRLSRAHGTGFEGVVTALKTYRRIRSANYVHIEFGSNDSAVFWFAVMAVLMRKDCVVLAHDYPKIINHPVAKLLGDGPRLVQAIRYRLLSPMLDSWAKLLLLRRAGVVAVFGPNAVRGMSELGAHTVVQITHGVDVPDPNPPPPSEGDSILCAGFLGAGKGVDILLEAWSRISDCVELPLVLMGAPSEPWFGEMLKRFRFEQNAPQLLGPVSDEREFQSRIDRSAIVVLPYRHSSPASGILVRALAAGRAVIATPAEAMRELRHDENAILVPFEDPPALADAIMQLVRSPEDRDRLGAAAQATARERFAWNQQVDGIEHAYAAAKGVRS